jgi:hypothetical protein
MEEKTPMFMIKALIEEKTGMAYRSVFIKPSTQKWLDIY